MRDCWLTVTGIVPVEKGRQHRDYFVPEGPKPSTQFGLGLGHVRVSTLGTNGTALHFEFKQPNSQTSRLIADFIEQSHAEFVNLEFHSPRYTLRSIAPRRKFELPAPRTGSPGHGASQRACKNHSSD